jgi:hypothetical protein
MCKTLLRLFFGLFAILFLAVGVSGSLFYVKFSDPNLYKQGFANADIYNKFDDYLTTSITANSNAQIGKIIDGAFTNYNDLFKRTLEQNIDNLWAWFKNEKTEIIVYFPKTDFIKSIDIEKIKSNIITSIRSTYDELPVCTPFQREQFLKVKVVEEFPECRFAEADAYVEKVILDIRKSLDKANSQEIVAESFNQGMLANLNEETKLETLLADQPTESQQSIRQTLDTVRNFFQLTKIVSIVTLSLGILFTLLTIVLGRIGFKPILATLGIIAMPVGIMIAVAGFTISMFSSATFSQNNIQSAGETPGILMPVLLAVLGALKDIALNFFQLHVVVGIGMLVGSIVLLIIAAAWPKPNQIETVVA